MKINKNWQQQFFTIWVGQALSLITSSTVQYALIWYLTFEVKSAAILSIATLVGILPMSILGPFIGSFVDRFNRKRIMIIADVADRKSVV